MQDSQGLENLQQYVLAWFKGFETRCRACREPRDTKLQRCEVTQPAEAYVGGGGS